MKKTVIVVSTLRDLTRTTRECVRALQAAGAVYIEQQGVPDVAFARSIALSETCSALRGPLPERDVVLMMDDDMIVDQEAAQEVVSHARRTGVAVSAAYATVKSTLAGTRWLDGPTPGRWLAGLGCLAIPRKLLLELEQQSESVELDGKVYSAFTWCGPENGAWVAEDYRLSKRLGGVYMLPVAVGHLKPWPLYPDDDTIERIREGGPV